jgi:HPt (histidine-containing phosphotransfer) domain-containing protein
MHEPTTEPDVRTGDAAAAAAPPIDLGRMAAILGTDDRDTLFSMLDIFADEVPILLPPIEAALAARDPRVLHDAAHKAKSAANHAAAPRLAALLGGLEADAAAGDWAGFGPRIAAIADEFARADRFIKTRGGGETAP